MSIASPSPDIESRNNLNGGLPPTRFYQDSVEIGGANFDYTCQTPAVVTAETPWALIVGGLLSEKEHYEGLQNYLASQGMVVGAFDPPSNQSLRHRLHPTHWDIMTIQSMAPWGVMKAMSQIPDLRDSRSGNDDLSKPPKFTIIAHSLGVYKAGMLAKAKPEHIEHIVAVAAACLTKDGVAQKLVPTIGFFLDMGPALIRRVEGYYDEEDPLKAAWRDVAYTVGYSGRVLLHAERRMREVGAAATRYGVPNLEHAHHKHRIAIDLMPHDDDPYSTEEDNRLAAAAIGTREPQTVPGNHLSIIEEPVRIGPAVYGLHLSRRD